MPPKRPSLVTGGGGLGLRDARRGGRRVTEDPSPPVEVGTTIVGDSVLPEAGEGGALDPVAPHADVVDVEGVADAVAGALLDTAIAWLFRTGQQPVAVAPRDVTALVAVEANFVWVDLSNYGEADLREVARWKRQDSERSWAVVRVSLRWPLPDGIYAACSSARTAPHCSWNRRRCSAKETVSFICWRQRK